MAILLCTTHGSGDINLNATGGAGDVISNTNIIIPHNKYLQLQNNDGGTIYDVNHQGNATADVTYLWPAAPTTADYVLVSNTTGTLTWKEAGTLDPTTDGTFGYWDRDNGTSTLSPRTANDNVNIGTGQFTTNTQVNTPLVTHTSAMSITTTASNGHITIDPHGTGEVLTNNSNIDSGTGTISSDTSFIGPLFTHDDGELTITTGSGNNNININANGSGVIDIGNNVEVDGHVEIEGDSANPRRLQLNNANNDGWIAHRANDALATGANTQYQWPVAPTSSNQFYGRAALVF